MDSSELLRRIRDKINRKVEIPSGEWKTSRQWAALWGLQQSQTNRLLASAVDAGVMEAKSFRVPCSTRVSYPIPHYREKPKA